MSINFALIGAAGYIAPRHIRAIAKNGGVIKLALDPHTSVGALDQCSLDTSFFSETELFTEALINQQNSNEQVQYVSICSPNYLHKAHIRIALQNRTDAICEKPLVLFLSDLDDLRALENKYGHKIFTILQLRVHPELELLKQKIDSASVSTPYIVNLEYFTPRGLWYKNTWKGNDSLSGGIGMNIGIHFFDLLIWLFGNSRGSEVYERSSTLLTGKTWLDNAVVNWSLSTNPKSNKALRKIVINGEPFEFSDGFSDLHTEVYKRILNGRGFGIQDIRPSIELINNISHLPIAQRT